MSNLGDNYLIYFFKYFIYGVIEFMLYDLNVPWLPNICSKILKWDDS